MSSCGVGGIAHQPHGDAADPQRSDVHQLCCRWQWMANGGETGRQWRTDWCNPSVALARGKERTAEMGSAGFGRAGTFVVALSNNY